MCDVDQDLGPIMVFEHVAEDFEAALVHHAKHALHQLSDRPRVEVCRNDRHTQPIWHCGIIWDPWDKLGAMLDDVIHGFPGSSLRHCTHLTVGEGVCQRKNRPDPTSLAAVDQLSRLRKQLIVLPPVANAREDVHVAEEGRLVLSVQFDSVLEVLCREVQPRVRHFHRSSQPVVGVRDHFRLFRNLEESVEELFGVAKARDLIEQHAHALESPLVLGVHAQGSHVRAHREDVLVNVAQHHRDVVVVLGLWEAESSHEFNSVHAFVCCCQLMRHLTDHSPSIVSRETRIENELRGRDNLILKRQRRCQRLQTCNVEGDLQAVVHLLLCLGIQPHVQ
mmetsp:Transcript_94870/g.142124  ORF Transcript_94870/g.142124 Transcript_94870/m.142124 type:complete len:335 (+) Transcript_94870:1194-2198(+)